MDRRKFFTACAIVAIPSFLKENADQGVRKLHRFDRENDRWVRVSPHEVRAEDIIWVDDAPYCDTVILVDRVEDDAMYSHWEIDKVTNQWVPAGSELA